jgi:hypothetical protein
VPFVLAETNIQEEDPTPTPNSSSEEKEMLRWPSEHVLLLIRLVEGKQDMFNTGLKKNVWLKIAGKITKLSGKKYTHEQVDNKWKGLKKTYKKIKDHNAQTGNDLKKWEFFYAIDSFMGNKPEISPPATCSTTKGLTVNNGKPDPFCVVFFYQYLFEMVNASTSTIKVQDVLPVGRKNFNQR